MFKQLSFKLHRTNKLLTNQQLLIPSVLRARGRNFSSTLHQQATTTSANNNTTTTPPQQPQTSSSPNQTTPLQDQQETTPKPQERSNIFLALDPETFKTLSLSNGKGLGVALKETQQKVSKITQTFRALLQNAWIFKAFTIFCILGLLVVEEYMKLSRVEQEFTTKITDEERDHAERAIERKKIEDELNQFALGSINQYSLICGQSGSGKTELCKRLINKAKEQGIPVFYTSASERQYEARLKSELGYFTLMTQFFHYVKKLLNVDSSSDILKDLEKVGKEIKKKTGKRPILFIDNCHQLLANPEGEQFLGNLQELAKRMADQECLNVILVVTLDAAKSAQRELIKREFSSRMRVYTVDEMTKEEAAKYLEKKFNITDEKQVEEITTVAGYVPKYLNSYNQLQQVTSSITEAFISAKVDPYFNNTFKDIARQIITTGYIDIHDFQTKTPPLETIDYTNGGCVPAIQPIPHPVRLLLEDSTIFTRRERRVTFKNSAIANYVKNILPKQQ